MMNMKLKKLCKNDKELEYKKSVFRMIIYIFNIIYLLLSFIGAMIICIGVMCKR